MSLALDTPSRDEVTRGARMITTDGRPLPLEAAHLSADAKAGLARVVLRQTFHNASERPVHVEYLLPLPADGVVSGFSFTIGDERVQGEVQQKRRARETYEAALVAGRTAAILEQTRTSVFQQEVGNIPPGESVEAEIVVDQPLRWLDEAGAWEWRFPTVVGPRYLGAEGRVADAGRLTVDVADRALSVRMGLELDIRDDLAPGARPQSPSHPLNIERRGRTKVGFASPEQARLDRDVVVQWPVAALAPGLTLDVARPSAASHDGASYGLLTLVPPAPGAAFTPVSRDLVALIDTSGSMGGAPLSQAKRIVRALIDTLTDRDQIELIAFDFSPRRFAEGPISASSARKQDALRWLDALEAGGGTEMRHAVQEALQPLRPDAQRQVVLITDGYIGFEQEIVEEVRRSLPPACRLHTVGVGSSVNRSLTEAAARAGAGIEVVLAPSEDPERAAQRLVARTDRPVVTELVVEGEGVLAVSPVRLPDLFAQAPAQVCLRLSGAGGEVRVRGRTADGTLSEALRYRGLSLGEGASQVTARFARERVADLEAHLAAGGPRGEIDAQIEALGLDFQIATRKTSWVAVSEQVRVRPGEEAATVRQPHEAPADVSLEGIGLRAPAPLAVSAAKPAGRMRTASRKKAKAERASGGLLSRTLGAFDEGDDFDAGDDFDEPAAELAVGTSAGFGGYAGEELEDLLEAGDELDDEAPFEDDDEVTASGLHAPELLSLSEEAPAAAEPSDKESVDELRSQASWSAPDAEARREDSPRVGRASPRPAAPGKGAAEPPRVAGLPRAPAEERTRDGLAQGAPAQPSSAPAPALRSPKPRPASVAPEAKRVSKRSRRWALVLAMVLAVLAVLWWWLAASPSPDSAAPAPAPARTAPIEGGAAGSGEAPR